MRLELEVQESYILFSSSIRSVETRKTYTLLLKKFIEFLGETDLLLGNNAKQVELKIIDFIMALRNQGKLTQQQTKWSQEQMSLMQQEMENTLRPWIGVSEAEI